MLYPSPSSSRGGPTRSSLQRLVLAVFMDTPVSYRLFLIKDIKLGELPAPQSTCFRCFHCVFACVQRGLAGADAGGAAFGADGHVIVPSEFGRFCRLAAVISRCPSAY